jgi:hypothetical protein
MINISPIFGQSRAKKKEIIADSKIKVEFIKTDPLWKYFKKRTAIYLPNVGKGGFIRRLEMEPSTNVELVVSQLSQLSIGLQAHKRIGKWFFESENDMERFKIVKSNLRLRFRQSPQQPGFGK